MGILLSEPGDEIIAAYPAKFLDDARSVLPPSIPCIVDCPLRS